MICQDDNCDFNPNFAVICSFIAQFGDKIDLELNIEQLKTSIEDCTQLDEQLIDLHVKLLKKLRRYFVRDQWEKALIRFASEYSYEDANEIQQLGYQQTKPSIKLNLLRRLLDAQFDCDPKFKAAVNLISESNELRQSPIGRDIKGNTYWQRSDNEGNFRLFQEQPLDYRFWKTVCKTTDELNNLINELEECKYERVKGEPMPEPYDPLPLIFPEYFIKKEEVAAIEEENKTNNGIQTTTTTANKTGGKKGRGKGRSGKKQNSLPILKEEQENTCNDSKIFSLTNGCRNSATFLDEKPIIVKTNDASNICTTQTSEPFTNLDQSSTESQVKTVLENLISRVVSSFEYLIRPLSRNSQERTIETPAEETKPKRKKPAKKAKLIEEEAPRRASSRIQQLQLKKVAEQEEEMKKMIELNAKKSDSMTSPIDEDSRSRGKSSSKINLKRSESPEDDSCKNGKNDKKRRKGGESWRRSKGKKKLSWDKDDSDLSSVSSITESNDDDDFEGFNELTFKYDNDDDEFACEDEETNNEPVIVKRARTARQSLGLEQQGGLDKSSILEEDKPCGRCDKSDDPEWILLCDMCDDGFHTSCCLPPLMIVPDGDWYCPPCEHKMLLIKLRELHASINEILEAKERERQKRQRLRQNNVKKVPAKPQEIDPPERRHRDILNELNEPMAIQELDEVLGAETSNEASPNHYKERSRPMKSSKHKRPARRRYRYDDDDDEDDDDGFIVDCKKPRRTYSKRDMSDSDEEEEFADEESESSEANDAKPKTRRARASVSYRFQEYDELIKSAIQGDSYDEEASESESEPENCSYGRGKDMATIEALAYQQENNLLGQDEAMLPSSELSIPQPKSKPKKKARRLNDLDAVSEAEDATSDESFQASSATEAEEEDEDLTEADSFGDSETSIDELISATYSRSKKKSKRRSSNYSDDSDYQPRSRRAASKRVSYKESTDEDEVVDIEMSVKKSKKNTLDSDEDSQASWKGSPQSVVDDDGGSTSCGDQSPNLQQNNNEQVEEIAKTEIPVLKTLSNEPTSVPAHPSFYDGDPTLPLPSNYNLN